MTSLPTTDQLRTRISGAALQRAFDYFAVQQPDRADFATAAARISGDAAALARVGQVVAALRSGMGRLLTQEQASLPATFDPQDPNEPVEARFFHAVAFAATLPDTLAFHRTRAIPDTASRAILADLGRHLRIFERTFGHTGLHVQNWLALHLRGVIYDFGRLQAELERLDVPAAELRAAGVPTVTGSVVAGIHIPDSGPLRPAEVDASLARVRPFLARHFPELPPVSVARCTSWLLDEQLCDLVPDSNIARFCARWHPIGAPTDGDWSVRNFVFRRPDADPADLVASTRLERAVLDHWRSGGHLHQRSGWLKLSGAVPS
ncbi:MAG TPA: acyltransferase domain-containing protein [Flexivirga sp.]|uniref:acyltransferase domain-containing protein n=1 Tax=Flexivirga sp. TaxID=1962927 RepID=UPI002D1985F1|nr:acyltransferase domain-containing protein [Flexivirga sp.]HWC20984.1 acyltransferase domain-containing protein [Flexivirga sp.]